MAIVSAGHALGVLNYVFLSSEGIKPDTRQAINIYRLSYSFVGFVCVQVCDHCSSMQLDIIMSPFCVPMLTQNEPRRQKTGLRGFRLGLGRYIDTSMHRDTDLADTRIDTLGAVSRYF